MMHFTRRHLARGTTALVAGAAFFLAACGSDPLDPGDDDHHADPAGVLVQWLGQEVLRYMDGDEVPDLELAPNTAYGDVSVTFLAEDGDPITLEEDGEFEIDLQIGDTSVLSWEPGEAGAPGTTPHFRVNLQTGTEGTTTVRLRLMHEGHADWESPAVTVILVEQDPV